jgi:small subunit ribosomal protein S21
MHKVPGNVVIVHDDNFERAVRKFKKKVQTSGVLMDLREREFYVKPTTRRKIKAGAARSRWRKYLQSHKLPPKNY